MDGLYILFAWGCVDPSVHGPYDSHEDRIVGAKALLAEEGGAGQESAVFKLDIVDGKPSAGSFVDDELE